MLGGLTRDGSGPVLLRITSTEVEFGAGDELRQVLARRRRTGEHHFAVWADEPLIRRFIPLALLHTTPPHGGLSWDAAVPAPPSPSPHPQPPAPVPTPEVRGQVRRVG